MPSSLYTNELGTFSTGMEEEEAEEEIKNGFSAGCICWTDEEDVEEGTVDIVYRITNYLHTITHIVKSIMFMHTKQIKTNKQQKNEHKKKKTCYLYETICIFFLFMRT